jgi:hypothetical protein
MEELVESTDAQFEGLVDPVEFEVFSIQLEPERVYPDAHAVQVAEYPDAEDIAVFMHVEHF